MDTVGTDEIIYVELHKMCKISRKFPKQRNFGIFCWNHLDYQDFMAFNWTLGVILTYMYVDAFLSQTEIDLK